MDDAISRKGTSAWLEAMGYPKLAAAVMNKKRFPPVVGGEAGYWTYEERRKFIDLANADLQYKTLGYPHRPYVNMRCSVCHKITIADETIVYRFCPHCGSEMR